jgi:hypothetical protein
MSWKEVAQRKLYQDWKSNALNDRDADTEEEVECAAVADEVIVMMQSESQFWSYNFLVPEQEQNSSQVEHIPLRPWIVRNPGLGA